MANTKKKSDSRNSNNKKNNSINLNKKTNNTKKKLEVPEEVKKKLKETELVKNPTKKKNISETNNIPVEKKILTPEEIAKERKERNRKKYEKGQRKYQDTKKIKPIKKTEIHEEEKKIEISSKIKEEKKKIEIPDEVKSKKKKKVKEEELVKKIEVEIKPTSKEKIKEQERKEKRKFNQGFTQTLNTLKEFSTTQIDIFKEKTSDKNIPIGKTEEDNKKRFSRVIKESIIYAVLLTIFDVICILVIDYFDFLRLFDVKALNIIITIIISLIFNFFVAFMVDHFATKIWLNKKHKKKDDDINGDNRVNQREYKENIRDKKRK